jgi:glucosamine-6-phosphate deaminase
MKTSTYEKIQVREYADRQELGRAAADYARDALAAARSARSVARVVVASTPTQNDFLRALVAPPPTIPWADVIVFHAEEYVGLSASHEQSARHYLRGHLLDAIPVPRAFHGIRGEAPSPSAECARYARLLRERPIDLVCLGIGEHGEMAFNSSLVADFDDRDMIKVAELGATCRQQAVNDGCFARVKDVPTHGFTLTVPALFSARAVSCVVAGERRAQAVRDMLLGPIEEACPASILRAHPNAVLHLDAAAASKL